MTIRIRSRFDTDMRDGNILRVIDRGGDTDMSVTNDAENVVAWLHQMLDLSDKRVEYVDSEGRVDRLLHDGGVFTGFAPGPWPQENQP